LSIKTVFDTVSKVVLLCYFRGRSNTSNL